MTQTKIYMTQTKIDGKLRKFARLEKKDPRDRKWLVPKPKKTAREYKYWVMPKIFDQGATPMCVAYAWLGFLHDYPTTHKKIPVFPPRKLYKKAQDLDDIPGTDYEGTTVGGGAKAVIDLGEDVEYRWAETLQQVIDTVLYYGPMVGGCNWTEDMCEPRRGVMKCNGPVVGGHAFVLSGVNVKEKFFRIQNSWSEDWGNKGCAKFYFDDTDLIFDNVVDGDSEFCIAMEKD